MPSPEAREIALLLLRKAEGDEAILDRVLDDLDVPDDVLGFHVQQSIEKRIKAVLAFYEVDYDRTHSINYLTSLLDRHEIDLPTARDEIERLTPWAVAARYEDDFQRVLDRAAARQAVSDVREWSRGLLGG